MSRQIGGLTGARYIASMDNGWMLQGLIDGRMTISTGCLDCGRSRELDLAALRDRYAQTLPRWNGIFVQS